MLSGPGFLGSYYYFHVGANLASGRGFTEDIIWNYLSPTGGLSHPSNYYWQPLTSVVAAPFMAVLGEPFRSAQVPMVILSAAIPGVTAGLSFRMGGSTIAMVHDLMAGPLPVEFESCDVLYAELPWRMGFARYSTEQGFTDGRTYRQFMAVVSGIVASRPTVLITGSEAARYLPAAMETFPVWFNRFHGIARCYGLAIRPVAQDTDLLWALSRIYGRIGDFCCGHGLSGRIFSAAKKTWVLADSSDLCIGAVAAAAPFWL
ncbi:MAG: hypothetical protein EXR51_04315 [Dehalococcoidia bacterium]|nr:hypothetical protein [Dehalococcoidia bacterium]